MKLASAWDGLLLASFLDGLLLRVAVVCLEALRQARYGIAALA